MALTKVTQDIIKSSLIPSGFKNKIIGGDFSINPWQRGTSFSSVANDQYVADRFYITKSGSADFSINKTLDSPANNNVFSQHCLEMYVNTPDATIATSDNYTIGQKIEGFNSASLGFGQTGSRKITLSFWVRSPKTGTHCVSFTNSAQNRSYVASYTVINPNTWEFKSITIENDTTGAWNYSNGIGLNVRFSLAAGASFQTTGDIWTAGDFYATSAQVNCLDTAANSFKLALIQLEMGETYSKFDSRGFQQELNSCKRYYEKSYSYSTTPGSITFQGVESFRRSTASEITATFNALFTVEKRTIPTVIWFNPVTGTSGQIYDNTAVANITVTGTHTSIPTSQTKVGNPLHAASGAQAAIIIGHWAAEAEL